MTPVDRELPTREAYELLDMVRSVAADRLRPLAAAAEQAGHFPRGLIRELGGWGLLGLPYGSAYGGGAQSHVVYLQVVEEIAAAWLTIAETISVHTLASYPLATFGTTAQKNRWLAPMLSGELLGAYCLSEPGSGSDAASLSTRAAQEGDDYVVDGTKAWITHAGHADVYNLMVRTGESGPDGISCLLADAATPGLTTGRPERKMGLRASPVAQLHLAGARVPRDRLIGGQGQGFRIALAALDSGRLGIAACAVGLARPRSTAPAPTQASVDSSAGRSESSKASDSCSRTWRRRSRPDVSCMWRPRVAATPASHSVCRRRWRNCSAPTWP